MLASYSGCIGKVEKVHSLDIRLDHYLCDTPIHTQAHRMGLGEEESASITASADMEVDSTFNAEQHTGTYVN